jgi:hypothetical protein
MAKTLRTSGDYTVKAGAGASGLNYINFDAKYTRVLGDLVVDGDQTILNTTSMTVEDHFMELNRNNSTAGTEDSGIFFNQGSSNHALFYYDAGNGEFQLGTSTQDASATTISNITLGQLKIASTPTDGNHAASKAYVDAQIVSGGFSIGFRGDDSAVVSVNTGNSVYLAGGSNLTSAATEEDTITLNLNNDLTNITSITSDASNGNLELTANGTGAIVINNILTFDSTASDPAGTPTTTKIYHKAVGGGDTGIYFKNPNDTVGELISKSKATALAIALG